MSSKKVVVVGAGLSGLAACISAARLGYEVTCLNMFSQEGGVPQSYPTVDGSPFDPALMSRWLGVPIGEPQVTRLDELRAWVFGKRYDLDPGPAGLYAVERGTRGTAIDNYLYERAVEMGVKFEFNHPILNRKELDGLPPDTIIATGPYTEMFTLLDIPNEMAYGYVARGVMKEEDGGRSGRHICLVYLDSYTKDYAYVASTNGIFFGLLFSRTPVGEREMDIWERQLAEGEDLHFNFKDLEQGPFRSRYPRAPRLFQDGKILCGTIAAAQDPGTYFGVHGGLVSGKIAAIALEDKATAAEMFKICNRSFNVMWTGRRVAINYSPTPARKLAFNVAMTAASNPGLMKMAGPSVRGMIPGYTLLDKYMEKRYSRWL